MTASYKTVKKYFNQITLISHRPSYVRIANVLTIIKLNINVYFPSNARAETMRKTIATNTADLILFHVKQKATKYPRNRPKHNKCFT